MTLDDLARVYLDAYRDAVPDCATTAGIRAVVEALRDEMYQIFRLDAIKADKFWNEILTSDGGTHGSPELDEDARKLEAMGQDAGLTFAPAADKREWSPVCLWRVISKTYGGDLDCKTGCKQWAIGFSPKNTVCPSCGKTIVFKEASHGE